MSEPSRTPEPGTDHPGPRARHRRRQQPGRRSARDRGPRDAAGDRPPHGAPGHRPSPGRERGPGRSVRARWATTAERVVAAREGRYCAPPCEACTDLRAGPPPPDAELKVRVLVHRAYLVAETRSSDEGLRLLEEIEQGPLPAALRGLSAVNRGLVLARRHAGQAVEAFDLALRLLPADDPEPRVAALINRGCIRLDVGDLTAAAVDFRRAVEQGERAGLHTITAMAASNLGYTFLLGGDVPAALKVSRRGPTQG